MIKKMYANVKKNLLINLSFVFLFLLSLLLFFVIIYFRQQTNEHWTFIENIYEDTDIFLLTDTLENFPAFLDEETALERTRTFYEGVRDAEGFEYVAVLDHPLTIFSDTFLGDERFFVEGMYVFPAWEGREGYVLPVSAMQLSQSAVDKFPLSVMEGRGFTSEDFTSFTGRIPVLLGNGYADFHNVGDIISGYFGMLEEFDFEVVGILEENQTVFYFRPDYFVDYHILMPNLDFGEPTDEEAATFRYLQRLYAFLFVENTTEAFHHTVNTIEALSETTNIPVRIQGMDEGVGRYNEIRMLTSENNLLVNTIFFISVGLIVIIISVFARISYNRNRQTYVVHNLLGNNMYRQVASISLKNFLVFLTAALLAVYLITFQTNLVTDWDIIAAVFRYNEDVNYQFYDFILWSFQNREVQFMLLYGLGLYFVSILYLIRKIILLYQGGVKQ